MSGTIPVRRRATRWSLYCLWVSFLFAIASSAIADPLIVGFIREPRIDPAHPTANQSVALRFLLLATRVVPNPSQNVLVERAGNVITVRIYFSSSLITPDPNEFRPQIVDLGSFAPGTYRVIALGSDITTPYTQFFEGTFTVGAPSGVAFANSNFLLFLGMAFAGLGIGFISKRIG